jgi:hypothetical protein
MLECLAFIVASGRGIVTSHPPPRIRLRLMSEHRNADGWWIVGLLVLSPVLYLLSFGPACWIVRKVCVPSIPNWVVTLYYPIISGAGDAPASVESVLAYYSGDGFWLKSMLYEMEREARTELRTEWLRH